jgi:hypothetical protein
MPLQATSGAASYDAFGGGVAAVPNYIEDVFSTWLYTGNGSTQTITNGIDLAGKGGLTWIKNRTSAVLHQLYTTNLGSDGYLRSNGTEAFFSTVPDPITYNANGFSLNTSSSGNNANAANYASWTFREAPKFFDVVTYTGNGTEPRNIPHNLGSVPGCIIVKCTSTARDWQVYHRSTPIANQRLVLNSTSAASGPFSSVWSSSPTSTVFSVGGDSTVNANGATYVAYLFAHNAGGFGLTGTDNVISCGSFTQASGGTTVNLGFEPQWVLVKNSSGTGNWFLFDNMRGNTNTLYPNLSNAEGDQGAGSFQYNATGFTMADYITGSVGSTLIYIAIRRGPMKVPTTGTSVFAPISVNNSGGTNNTTNFPVDLQLSTTQSVSFGDAFATLDRLRGISTSTTALSAAKLATASTSSEGTETTLSQSWSNVGFQTPSEFSGVLTNYLNFRRSPSYMDVVCYNGTSSAQALTHNLAAVPELMLVKRRNFSAAWSVYAGDATRYLVLNTNAARVTASDRWNNTAPTESVFTVGTGGGSTNESGGTFVAYLFASAPGVSKVGSYTGTGTTQVINCGFTGGARFVLIKATSTTGNWLVWDSARGIVSGNDPYLALNSTAAEVTNTDWVDTAATGFELSNAGGNLANSSGVSYVFLAVA